MHTRTNAAFSSRLYERAAAVREKSISHPFVEGIGSGLLEKELFIHYLKQDYVYLIDYARLFAAGVQKAPDIGTMARFSHILHETIHTEMDLHRKTASHYGISEAELENTEPAPLNLAYTKYMLAAAQSGTLADLVACLLPCAWDYWEIGKHLKEQCGGNLEGHPYAAWIKTYSSEKFGDSARWLIELMNELSDGLPERDLAVLEQHFLTTSKFEYLFWDMNYRREQWPL